MIGIMEYIAPTLAFLLGVAIYKEPFKDTHFWGFLIIWISLFLLVAR
jgi:chloramphenicol-sensitive protein RarD